MVVLAQGDEVGRIVVYFVVVNVMHIPARWYRAVSIFVGASVQVVTVARGGSVVANVGWRVVLPRVGNDVAPVRLRRAHRIAPALEHLVNCLAAALPALGHFLNAGAEAVFGIHGFR